MEIGSETARTRKRLGVLLAARWRIGCLLVAAILGLCTPSAQAQPPANDDCAGAVSLNALTFANSITATPDISLASHGTWDPGTCTAPTTNAPYDIWYRFDSTVAGTIVIDEFGPVNAAAAIYVAAPTSGATCPTSGPATICPPVSAAMSGARHQRFLFAVAPETTYFIQISVNSAIAAPTVPLDLRFALFPPNGENCDAAVEIVGTGVFTLHNNAATAPVAPFDSILCTASNATMNNDVWFKWVAPGTGKASIVTRTYPAFPAPLAARIAIFNESEPGVCPTAAGHLIRCVNNINGVNSLVGTGIPDGPSAAAGITDWNVVAGRTYFVQLASQTAGTTGSADFELLLQKNTVGRCCLSPSSCILTSEFDCTGKSGTYGGDFTACVPATADTSTYAGAGFTIPDNTPGTGGSITVSDTFTVDDVEVDIDLNHASMGDLRLALTKDGRFVTLSNRGRRGYNPAFGNLLDFAGAYTFSDTGTFLFGDPLTSGGTVVQPGTYIPTGAGGVNSGLRNTFHGLPAAGVWTLTVADELSTTAGIVNSWTLRLKRGGDSECGGAPATVNCCRGTTCLEVAAGTCTGTVAGSNSVEVAACTGNTITGCCFGDYDHNGTKDITDIFTFLNAWFGSSIYADITDNGASTPDITDIFTFLNAWFGSCE